MFNRSLIIILFRIIYCVVLNSTSFPWSFIFPQQGVVKERPWFRLVMCLGDKTIFLGGVPTFQKIVATSICHIKNESQAITMFFGNLHSWISGSSYCNVNLKPNQVKCLEAVYSGRDVAAVLLTGFGKSIIFHLWPTLLFEKVNSAIAPPSPSSCTIHPHSPQSVHPVGCNVTIFCMKARPRV